MGKNTVIHTCGHEQIHDLYGKHSERERRAAWLATTVCSECYRKERHDAAVAQSVGLPDLAGSEKQAAWAIEIRAGQIGELDKSKYAQFAAIDNIAELVARLARPDLTDDQKAEMGRRTAEIVAAQDAVREAIKTIKDNADAKWWIDNRDLDIGINARLWSTMTGIEAHNLDKMAKTALALANRK